MVHYCCVPLCKSSDKDGIILYRIPKDLEKRAQYQNAINRKNWTPTYEDRICEVQLYNLLIIASINIIPPE